MALDTPAAPNVQKRRGLPWMVLLFIPRLAFYAFLAFRWWQIADYARHAKGWLPAERTSLPLTMGVVMLVFAGLIEGTIWGIAAIVLAARRGRRKAEQQWAAYAESLEAEAQRIAAQPLAPIEVPGLVLQPGEHCYLCERAELFGLQTIVERVGGTRGASVRVPGTHGAVRLNVGGFRSTPVPRTAMAHLATAQIVLTNTRIVVMSPSGNATTPIKNVIAIKPFTDGVQIDFAHGKPLIAVTGNQRIGLLVQRVVHETTPSP